MRKSFVEAIIRRVNPDSSVFLTGDLGFMALEPLREAMNSRFINAGVAEQNMISVAAGLAKTGLSVWVYSIAPFCYARPFEQIRNDICLHNLPVHLVGNGGGYGYGVMGSTHHALEDYGVLLTLPGMRAFVPAFASDLDAIITQVQNLNQPSYLRLGRCELPDGFSKPAYAAWRRLTEGRGQVIVAVGPLAGSMWRMFAGMEASVRPDFWVVSELPLKPEAIPREFVTALESARPLWVVEEHVAQGSFGHMLASWVLQESFPIPDFCHYYAKGYPSGTFGSQAFHRTDSGIDAATVVENILMRERVVQGS